MADVEGIGSGKSYSVTQTRGGQISSHKLLFTAEGARGEKERSLQSNIYIFGLSQQCLSLFYYVSHLR